MTTITIRNQTNSGKRHAAQSLIVSSALELPVSTTVLSRHRQKYQSHHGRESNPYKIEIFRLYLREMEWNG
jgi:hypothetical protein